jgi:hypothetical protein
MMAVYQTILLGRVWLNETRQSFTNSVFCIMYPFFLSTIRESFRQTKKLLVDFFVVFWCLKENQGIVNFAATSNMNNQV